MKFRFRLARVLKVKKIWEDQAKLKLAAAVTACKREEQLLSQKKAHFYAAWTRLTASGQKEAQWMQEHFMLAQMGKDDHEQQKTRVQEANSAFERAQGEFVQRRAQRRVLSRLEEKSRAEFIQAAQRKELKQLDEVASTSHLKHQRRIRGG